MTDDPIEDIKRRLAELEADPEFISIHPDQMNEASGRLERLRARMSRQHAFPVGKAQHACYEMVECGKCGRKLLVNALVNAPGLNVGGSPWLNGMCLECVDLASYVVRTNPGLRRKIEEWKAVRSDIDAANGTH